INALTHLHTHGTHINWTHAYHHTNPRTINLPTYPFQRQRHWPDSLITSGTASPTPSASAAVDRRTVPADEHPVPDTPAPTPAPARTAEPREIHALVVQHVADSLGYAHAHQINPRHTFTDLGFDSFSAVEFRDRLGAAVGLPLPAGLVFECPTPHDVAEYLTDRLAGPAATAGTAADGVTSDSDTDGSDDPLVVVGMACRYPGGVGSPEQLWDLVV
ncbi:phosphopantetheine-binding protein, partial [Streptomyces sp. DT24]|uniref:acyl carrier protein n=1 Tax=Streptomyces sp. DT24 TaxID=3416520 RepID=UPI003CE83CDA